MADTFSTLGSLRISNRLRCEVIHGHKPGAAVWLTDGNQRVLIATCKLCGAQKLIDREQIEQLVQIGK